MAFYPSYPDLSRFGVAIHQLERAHLQRAANCWRVLKTPTDLSKVQLGPPPPDPYGGEMLPSAEMRTISSLRSQPLR
jgi:hypothetical protein